MAKVTRRYCPRCFEAYDDGRDSCPDHDLELVALAGSAENLEGKIVDDKYEIIDILGKGGMGTVYRAKHMVIGREVALKVLRKDYLEDHKGVARFVREARAASLLKSRYSAMLHDFGLAPEGFLYYTMELASGRLLSDIIDRDGAVGPERTMHIAADICHSLAEAHANNIVHRDIKADNIMVSEDPDGHEIGKVLDFGTAKLIDTMERSSRVTDPGIVCGTPEYMSPEQAQAFPVDGRSDLYSLAVLMFELLTGRLPFTGTNSIAVLMKHVNDEPPRPRDLIPGQYVSDGLESLILQMLSKSPDDRPRSAVAVLRELQKLLEDRGHRTGSTSDLSEHDSFALDQDVEDAYRSPRRNTLIEIMDSESLRHAGSGSTKGGRATMELSPGKLWHEGQDNGRSVTEKDLQILDTVKAMEKESTGPLAGPLEGELQEEGSASTSATSDPSAATAGKLRELPGAVVKGVDDAAGRASPKRGLAPSLVALTVGGLLGGVVLFFLVMGGFFEAERSLGEMEPEALPALGKSSPAGSMAESESERPLPSALVEREADVIDSGDEHSHRSAQVAPLARAEEVEPSAPGIDLRQGDLVEVVVPAAVVDVLTRAEGGSDTLGDGSGTVDVEAEATPAELPVDREGNGEDVMAGPAESSDLVASSEQGDDAARKRKRRSDRRKEKREKKGNEKKNQGAKGGPVDFTLDDLQ